MSFELIDISLSGKFGSDIIDSLSDMCVFSFEFNMFIWFNFFLNSVCIASGDSRLSW